MTVTMPEPDTVLIPDYGLAVITDPPTAAPVDAPAGHCPYLTTEGMDSVCARGCSLITIIDKCNPETPLHPTCFRSHIPHECPLRFLPIATELEFSSPLLVR